LQQCILGHAKGWDRSRCVVGWLVGWLVCLFVRRWNVVPTFSSLSRWHRRRVPRQCVRCRTLRQYAPYRTVGMASRLGGVLLSLLPGKSSLPRHFAGNVRQGGVRKSGGIDPLIKTPHLPRVLVAVHQCLASIGGSVGVVVVVGVGVVVVGVLRCVGICIVGHRAAAGVLVEARRQ